MPRRAQVNPRLFVGLAGLETDAATLFATFKFRHAACAMLPPPHG